MPQIWFFGLQIVQKVRPRVCCRVEQSADSMGAAQIEIQAKKFFHGFLEKSFKIQSCQKPNKN